MFEKLLTKKAETGILFILLTGMIIVFVCLPIISITFEKSMQKLAYQEISDLLEIGFYQVYRNFDVIALSKGMIILEDGFIIELNDFLNEHMNHPQVKRVEVMAFEVISTKVSYLQLEIQFEMVPTLYRSFWHIENSHQFEYQLNIPLDKKGIK